WPDPPEVPPQAESPFDVDEPLDLSDVRGLPNARIALATAAAGGHHLLLVGPPGVGKTMLARRLPTILPPLLVDEALEVTKVHSAAGTLRGPLLGTAPPFRAPHHSASPVALVGGGSGRVRPAESPAPRHSMAAQRPCSCRCAAAIRGTFAGRVQRVGGRDSRSPIDGPRCCSRATRGANARRPRRPGGDCVRTRRARGFAP